MLADGLILSDSRRSIASAMLGAVVHVGFL